MTSAGRRRRPPGGAACEVGYRQVARWLTDAEHADLVEDLRGVLRARLELEPAEGRRRRVVSTVLLPVD